jgi:hypothetical protein
MTLEEELEQLRQENTALRACHLTSILPSFLDNLPRCQAPLADELSLIIWRGIAIHGVSILKRENCTLSN